MEVVLYLHMADFDSTLERFRSTAFQPSSDGSGISVVLLECINRTKESICQHGERYYSDITPKPPLFWVFDTDALPAGHKLIAQASTTGDDCHLNITDVSRGKSKTFFKAQDQTEFRSCVDGEGVQLTREIIAERHAEYWASLAALAQPETETPPDTAADPERI